MASLVLYYSRTGENYFGGSIKSVAVGNTARVAQFVAQAAGAETFEIKTVNDYPADYYACTDVAQDEKNANARPAIEGLPILEGIDTIYLGYPNWWGTCPMCVFTCLDGLNLDGVRIAPFCTNEGSGLGSSVRDLKRLYPQAQVAEGLSISGSRAQDSQSQVEAWVRKLG